MDYQIEIGLKRELFKKSYFEFFKWAFAILKPQEKYEDTFHIKYLCDKLQDEIERIIRREGKNEDLIINIPPRTSKSLITSVALLAWVWTKAPHLSMIAISYDDNLSLSNAQYCKDIIKSDQYRELFPEVQIRKDIDSKGEFQNTKGGSRRSTTTGANITGKGAEIIVVDDPQNPQTSEQEVERKKVIKYWIESLYNRLTPLNLGIRVLVQQRLHHEDLTGFLLKNHRDEYFHISLPAQLSKDVYPVELRQYYIDGLLDPVRLSLREITKLRKQGDRFYAGQYMQIPSPEEGGIIKRAWFETVEPSSITREPENEPIHFFIDTAYTEKVDNDPTAILVCFKKGNFLYVLDVVAQWLAFPDLINYIISYTSRFQYTSNSKIFIEPKASGISVVQQLRVQTNLNVIETKPPDKDKVTRAHSITPTLQSLRVKLVNGIYIPDYLDELGAFPTGLHDDKVDVTVMAVTELLINTGPDWGFL